MRQKFKHTTLFLGIKLLFINILMMIISLIFLVELLGISANSMVLGWVISIAIILIYFTIVYMSVATAGRRAIQIDAANEKRNANDLSFQYKKIYYRGKGFLAGAMAQAPIIVISIIWAIAKSQGGNTAALETILKFTFNQYFQIFLVWDMNIITILLFVGVFIILAGLSYFSAEIHRNKVMKQLKSNADKVKQTRISKK